MKQRDTRGAAKHRQTSQGPTRAHESLPEPCFAPGLGAGSGRVAESPLYGVAMLKIAMELKKPGARGLDDILSGVLAKMHIREEDFRDYLHQNGGLLRAIAQGRGY